jgi:hypothetical protein
MRSLLIALVLTGCGSPTPPPPAHNALPGAVSPPEGPSIDALRAAIEMCSHVPLPADGAFDIEVVRRPTKLKLRITYAPKTSIEGKTFTLDLLPHFDVDDGTQTCDGIPIRMPVIADTNLQHLIDLAQICARGEPWNGKGADSPLVWEHPIVHVRDAHLTVEYDERDPHTKPPGAELAVDPVTGQCSNVPRE